MAKPSRKEMVFAAAAQLFREKGYLAASMRELAERVGLEQASSLYNHLKSKEEVLQKICFDCAQEFTDGIQKIEATAATPAEQLRALIRLHITIATQNATSITVFNDEWRHLSEPSLGKFLQLRRDYEQRCKAIIEQGIANGDFRSVDSNVALYTLLTAVRWVHYWYRPDREISIEQLEADMTRLLLGGLENPPSSPPE